MFQQNLINIQGQTYKRRNQIGFSGQAVRYQGENIQTHEKVAIRVVNDMTEDEYNIHQILIQQKKNFLIDIEGMEYQEENGTIVTVMELGIEDFHSFMEKNEFKQFTNLDKNLVFYQMVQAVYELHELQYFHRNLKTENFIIIENFNKNRLKIKLINFGLCRHIQNQNRCTQNIGSILFMAPEQLSSDQYDKSSDIWSLGCIYYEIMMTQTFLEGTTYQALIDQIQAIYQSQIDQKIDQIAMMNFDEKNLLKRMLQKEPSQRLTLKEILWYLDKLTKTNFQPIHQDKPFNIFPQNCNLTLIILIMESLEIRITIFYQKYQKQFLEVIAKQKKEIDEQLQNQIIQKKKEIKQQNLYEIRKLEKKIKQEYDEKISLCSQDKKKLKRLQIAYEQLQIQQKEQQQKNLHTFQEQKTIMKQNQRRLLK